MLKVLLSLKVLKTVEFSKRLQIFFEIEHFFGQKKMVTIWQFFPPKKRKMTALQLSTEE